MTQPATSGPPPENGRLTRAATANLLLQWFAQSIPGAIILLARMDVKQGSEGTLRQAPVTVNTVAKAAGVSATTVSRVLSGKVDTISEGTRSRVLAAAQELGYRPNQLAVSLRMRSTKLIGLLVGDITDGYFHTIARGVEDTARSSGFHVILCNTDRSPSRELRYVELLEEMRCDGIIFAGAAVDGDRHLQGRRWRDLAVVLIGPHDLSFPTLQVDNRGAMAAAVAHLAQQGCRRIACVGRHPGWVISEARLEGYRAGLIESGLELDPELEWDGDFTFESGVLAVQRALERRVPFDGLVAFNDYSALGAIQALREAGRRIPDDICVIGCDDLSIAAMVSPPLSSVALPVRELGALAMRMIIQMVHGDDVPQRVDHKYELRARESSLRTK